MTATASILAIAMMVFTACGDDGGSINENEVITTVVLSFAPTGGATQTFEFDDPDGDGGQPGASDPINLAPAAYTLTVQFQNRLVDPPEEITSEVMDESDLHLLLFTGTAVVGPATSNASGPLTQSYADMDVNGLPIGLSNDIIAAAGTGQLTVTLRHMPPEEPPQKASDTLAMVKAGGVGSIGGSTDAQVNFAVTVQ